MQVQSRKVSPSGSYKDLWLVVREGSLADVDLALALLKKNGGNINSRNTFGLTPLHIATWRNHIPIIRRLLIAGADPNARDGESGWTCLHRALHFGHLAVASILLQSGASLTLEDSKSRMPIDLLSGPVLQAIGDRHDSATEVFSWGSGANYQLGTGNAHLQKLPCKVDALHGSLIKLISAAKFHSVAVSARGEVYTWGFGRGGRLGHPDFDIHSGQAAVITPRQVISGLGSRRVKAIAAAKHHSVLATESGEVFTWGSNREGQLGYTVDTQPTPRRVSSLKSRIVAVAAANKHTAVVSDSGEVFTWGCNKEGQLGYGTSNSASNYNPRMVEYLKGKFFTGVAVAKYHTIVLGSDGEVYTWGHRLVTPRRVVIARNLKKFGSCPLKFHRMERLHVASIAAGMVHSLALTDDGALFYWVSADPDLRCQQLYSLCGKQVVSISVGKYWSAVATVTGDVYMWDGKKGEDKLPAVTRLHGVKRATSVSVGETHLLIVGSLYHPNYPPSVIDSLQKQKLQVRDEVEELDEDFVYNDTESNHILSAVEKDDSAQRPIPSLKSLCEKVAAESLVEPRNAIQMLEIADSLGAEDLRKHCQDIVIHNLDYILTVSPHAFASASPEILANLENLLDQRSSEPWSYRRLPTPTATFPLIINSEEEDSECEVPRTRDNHNIKSTLKSEDERSEFFLQKDDPNQAISKKVRALRKKLQQIEMLETKQSKGHILDDQQLAKLHTRLGIESSLTELGLPVETVQANASVGASSDVKCNKKAEVSRKQRRKSKQKVAQVETVPGFSGTDVESNFVKRPLDVGISQVSANKEEKIVSEGSVGNQASKELAFFVVNKETSDSPKSKSPSPSVSKKKNRKGGLSMFLSGALDDTPKETAPPPQTPRSEGPAWGGAKVSKGFASLREIQDEQSKTKVNQSTKNIDQVEDHSDGKSDGKVKLISFLPSKPIPVVSLHTSPVSDAERSTPPWASGTPPFLSRPSLRDIQMQQQGKQKQNNSHSPKTRTAGFSIASGQGSPSDSPGVSRWFKPEVNTPSSIRSIQIEEKAMKDLKRFYSTVKIVKNPT
ncbi:hypothetical protein MANES_09G139100v8 [Manihot esculenta]|uniref:RCC1-like domain-containing protein n=3 Tax=Manihot esculenta TaxID=3983 RepID=A0A2C9VAL9_MANES|nr:hypothetical protein MANES_09G139100v8 [Manihot esculenta]KAG8648035.1 hypothetical protein MANES_09G139100v8 [Manihot esculenta]OAY41911.1 hypothetical protein MANES_09G139100v8 [Manihot esculenta]